MVNKGTSSFSFQFCLGLQSTSDAETVIKTIHLHSKKVSNIRVMMCKKIYWFNNELVWNLVVIINVIVIIIIIIIIVAVVIDVVAVVIVVFIVINITIIIIIIILLCVVLSVFCFKAISPVRIKYLPITGPLS